MPEKTIENTIQERFNQLPQTLQDVILSGTFQQGIMSVAQKHNLHIDQTGKLENETMLVVLGIEPPDAFGENLMRELDIDEEKATTLVTDLNNEVFLKLRSHMEEHSYEEEQETPTSNDNIFATAQESATSSEAAPTEVTGKEKEQQPDAFTGKFTQVWRNQTKHIDMSESEDTPSTAQGKPPRDEDPYREPIE